MSSNSNSESEEHPHDSDRKHEKLKRPKLLSRVSSSTIIVPRDTPNIELTDEEYAPGDARTMSPRRTSEEVDRLGETAREALLQ
jgi:short coiled-coil protein